jgi:acyl-CoA dehydrogenase
MAWDFETEPEFEEKLAWMRTFVREEIIPLEALADKWRSADGRKVFATITAPLKEEVKRQGLWAAHLPPDMGGQGFGQVKLGLMHEILGQTPRPDAVRAGHLRQPGTRQRQRRADRRRWHPRAT